MNIEDLLTANMKNDTPMEIIEAYKQVTPLHLGIMKKMGDETFDFYESSDRTQSAVYEMVENGLVEDNYMLLTEFGSSVMKFSAAHGSLERKTLAYAKSQMKEERIDIDDSEEIEE